MCMTMVRVLPTADGRSRGLFVGVGNTVGALLFLHLLCLALLELRFLVLLLRLLVYLHIVLTLLGCLLLLEGLAGCADGGSAGGSIHRRVPTAADEAKGLVKGCTRARRGSVQGPERVASGP